MPPAEKDRPGKIFIGGLSEDTVEGTIETTFSKFGKITEIILVRNRESNVSRGFGFVTYENPSDADVAVKKMNGQELEGKTLKVDSALKALHSHDQGNRGRGGRGAMMGRGGGSRGSFGGGGRGHPQPPMRRGFGGPQRGGMPGGNSRGRGGLLGDGRSMMMRGRGGPPGSRPLGPRPLVPSLGGRPMGPPNLMDREREARPSRSRGGYNDAYGERALLTTPRRYEDDEFGPPMKRSRPDSSYPEQGNNDYPSARGDYTQEENGYGRAPRYDYGDVRADPSLSRDRIARDPAAPRGYPAGREPPREYVPARERDPYAARANYNDAPVEREGYAAPRREPPTAARPHASAAYEDREFAPRSDPYERPAGGFARDYAAEARPARPARPAYADPYADPAASKELARPARPARPAYPDPYADPAAAKDYGTQARGRASTSYSASRDPYAEARVERPRMDYGARDPFGASADTARSARRVPPATRGYERF